MTPLTTVLASRHLPALDGLRAVAVLMVLVYHFGYDWFPGDLGVTGFFVLSGFLITWLLYQERERTGRVALRAFYMRRTLRIFPAYYAFLLLGLVATILRGRYWGADLLFATTTFMMNYFQAFQVHPGTYAAHMWSLAVEEQFYLIWPVTFLALWRLGRRATGICLSLVIVAVLIWRSLLYLGLDVGAPYVYHAFDTRLDGLAIGCLLAMTLRSPLVVERAHYLARWSWLPAVTFALILLSRTALGDNYHYSLGFTVDPALFALLIVQLFQLHRHSYWSWIGSPLIRYIGRISYPMYLFHPLVLPIGKHLPFVPSPVGLVIGVVLTILVASGSFFFVEQPFLRLKRRFERRRDPEPEPLGTARPDPFSTIA